MLYNKGKDIVLLLLFLVLKQESTVAAVLSNSCFRRLQDNYLPFLLLYIIVKTMCIITPIK